MAGFRATITRFMKSERSRLKTRYLKDEETVPTHIHSDQWKRLKDYWKTDAQKLKSKKMAEARQSVKNYALVGRKGKAARDSVVVRTNQFSYVIVANFFSRRHVFIINHDSRSMYFKFQSSCPSHGVDCA